MQSIPLRTTIPLRCEQHTPHIAGERYARIRQFNTNVKIFVNICKPFDTLSNTSNQRKLIPRRWNAPVKAALVICVRCISVFVTSYFSWTFLILTWSSMVAKHCGKFWDGCSCHCHYISGIVSHCNDVLVYVRIFCMILENHTYTHWWHGTISELDATFYNLNALHSRVMVNCNCRQS